MEAGGASFSRGVGSGEDLLGRIKDGIGVEKIILWSGLWTFNLSWGAPLYFRLFLCRDCLDELIVLTFTSLHSHRF